MCWAADDLEVAPDFFSYFSALQSLLDEDDNLWCVSAWNDNGKPDNMDLHSNGELWRAHKLDLSLSLSLSLQLDCIGLTSSLG